MEFKAGDVVELKSGGPKMTVIAVVGQDQVLDIAKVQGFTDGDVSVEYFSNNKLEKSMFRKSSIQLVKAASVTVSLI